MKKKLKKLKIIKCSRVQKKLAKNQIEILIPNINLKKNKLKAQKKNFLQTKVNLKLIIIKILKMQTFLNFLVHHFS